MAAVDVPVLPVPAAFASVVTVTLRPAILASARGRCAPRRGCGGRAHWRDLIALNNRRMLYKKWLISLVIYKDKKIP